jgi:ectoine hydroxylase-related dioxygenase (phytanoyl-CoA dioxygenase family)
VCLFNDQYIVKPPSSAAARFTWHRDSQWCDEAAGSPTLGKRKTEARNVATVANAPNAQRVPYVSLWTALDDVDTTNGCVRVLPYPAARDAECEIHFEDASRRLDVLSRNRWREDLSDRERDEAAAAFRDVRVCVMRAGDTLCMSDRVLHCSGPNASGALRRAWMPQFSKRAIRKRDGEPTALAVPARSVGNA